MTNASRVEVAVGVVFNVDGAVLFGERVPGKPYAGWWEFPGGKLEPGETVEQALVRELKEELGLDVTSSLPWVVRDFVYPHASVRLHFRRVTGFAGEAQSREGQRFVWQHPRQITVGPMLPAALPVIEWLQLPTRIITLRPASPPLAELFRPGSTAEHSAMLLAQCGTLGLSDAQAWMRELRVQVAALPSPSSLLRPSLLFSADDVTPEWHPILQRHVDGWVGSLEQAQQAPVRQPYARAGVWCNNAADIDMAAANEFDFALTAQADADALSRLATQTRLPLFALADPQAMPGLLLHGVIVSG